jgi:hypothetical protein
VSDLGEPMRWRRLGHVFTADRLAPWARSHAYCPTLLPLPDGRLRAYVAFMDSAGVGRIGYVDFDPEHPSSTAVPSAHVVLDIGRAGAFDDHGVTPLAITPAQGDSPVTMLYAGWSVPRERRYEIFTGVATSNDGRLFRRASPGPVLGACPGERSIRSSATVVPDGHGWRIFYASGDTWEACADGVERPRYGIRTMWSDRLDQWSGPGDVIIGLQPSPDEIGLARPCVLMSGDTWVMWFSHRSTRASYRLGFAHSGDGVTWHRDDANGGLPLGPAGAWDSKAIGLSSITTIGDRTYLAYNGNDLGQTGFGLAVLERD